MSLIHCAIRCAENRACISLHFHKGVRKCQGYETLMLTPQAGTNEEGWIYYYSTQKGICPHGYAHTRLFDYCVGYEGHFTDDVGFQKCREKSGRASVADFVSLHPLVDSASIHPVVDSLRPVTSSPKRALAKIPYITTQIPLC
uniref:Uncharacterized protein n=1 Tax=Magallana gigas TaxID=29159 RepID=K1QRM7_MAGGI